MILGGVAYTEIGRYFQLGHYVLKGPGVSGTNGVPHDKGAVAALAKAGVHSIVVFGQLKYGIVNVLLLGVVAVQGLGIADNLF